jgi:phospholipid/cholesterol/gamma-HCH transport system permease protein
MSALPETPPAPPAPPRPVTDGALEIPTRLLHDSGLVVKFTGLVVRDTFNGRVLRFIAETVRQAGILIISSTLVIWGLVFIIGLQCGIEGAYLLRSEGSPQYAGVFAAWCDLRELAPLCFGYMMAAKVGTGIVAELGSMRISEEIDALEVMGISGVTFLCSTRLLASWLVLPFMYLGAVAWGFLASYIAVVQQVANVSAGGYSLIFWEFQNPGDLLYSLIKAMAMATVIVLVGCYYGYTASGGPVGVGTATAKSMVVNIVSVHVIGMLGTQLFWGANPRAPIGG